jgi:peptide/nickel transport system substrate-binding protein
MIRHLFFSCLLAGVAAGCAHRSAALPSEQLVVATLGEPASLNPLYLEGTDASDIRALAYSFLTTYDAGGDVIADAAAFVPTLANGGISRDGKHVVYHLRRDIKWQDGRRLTARDVAFTYSAIVNPANVIPSRSGYDHIARVRALDDYTVAADLTRPQAAFVTNFFGGDSNYGILPAHLLARYPNLNRVAFNELPIGSGPYRFTKWARGDRIDLEANDGYYGTKPRIKHLRIRIVRDEATIVNELITHEADATFSSPPATYGAIRSLPHHRVIVSLNPTFAALLFNVTDSLMRQRSMRLALASAIDRRALVAKAVLGLDDADSGMRGMFTWAYDARAGAIAYDPVRARSLLTNEGWLRGSDGIRVKSGRRLEVQLVFSTATFGRTPVVPMLIQDARAVGIDLYAKSNAPSAYGALDSPLATGRFQVALVNYQNGMDPDASTFLSCDEVPPRGFNRGRYCNAEVDRALQAALAVYDRTERRRKYAFVQRRIVADVPYDFLWQGSEIDVVPTALHGYEPSPVSPYASVAHWTLER